MSAAAGQSVPTMVSADGVRLALRSVGTHRRGGGSPVLALHGVPDDGSTWDGLGAVLGTDRLVLAPDLPGLGSSEVHGPYDSESVARTLAALVLHVTDGLPGDGRVDVVGHDWGGILGLALAAGRPDLIRRIVVVNAPYRTLSLLHAPHVPFFALPLAPEALFRLGGARVGQAMVHAAWRSATPAPASLLAAAAGYAAPGRARAMLGYYRAAVRSGSRPGRVSVERGLVVWGVRDPVLRPPVAAAALRDLGAGTPDSRQVNVPEAGHWPHLEAPEATLPAIAEFLRAP